MNVRKKCALMFLSCFLGVSYAERNQFDMFDNRVYLDGGANVVVLKNQWQQSSKVLSTNAGIGVEKLFVTSRVWFDFELGNLMTYHELDNNLMQSPKNPLPFDPNFFSMNLKLGRAFQVVDNQLQITPYVLLGKNGNMTPYTVVDSAQDINGVKYINSGLSNFFWTSGIGGRLEYAVNETFDFYLDENLNYNLDNSKIQSPYVKQTNLSIVNLVGIKWQAWRELQFAVEGFYTYQDYLLSMSQDQNSEYNPSSTFGTRLTVGLTF
jgi:hypothetical protein